MRLMLTDEDARIIMGQSRRLRETSSSEESRLSNPAWTDYFQMLRLTELRRDFNKNRIRIASGVDQ